jgi:hypothetical protein
MFELPKTHKRSEPVTGGKTKVNLFASPDIIRVTKWVGYVAQMGETRNSYNISVGKPEEKRSLGKPRRRWEDNIRMDPRKIWWEVVDWIHLAQDWDHWRAFVNTVMDLQFRTLLHAVS